MQNRISGEFKFPQFGDDSILPRYNLPTIQCRSRRNWVYFATGRLEKGLIISCQVHNYGTSKTFSFHRWIVAHFGPVFGRNVDFQVGRRSRKWLTACRADICFVQ
ncbi:hypothetical protein B9Z55_028669 [Caenorhabditis nigoni]|uniref:Uncharacterized protein n=1 Tax=Caenorhabditis nigoni TaxID=1611254 RepID=A0A2G5SAW3_9PELO|nr:hypothetical protein B9Z55_028666 [Caenorhabditis nigoni]PIC12046.1 hypothetical protein B9Z55_028669 [Caenorhabditis nigoni]